MSDFVKGWFYRLAAHRREGKPPLTEFVETNAGENGNPESQWVDFAQTGTRVFVQAFAADVEEASRQAWACFYRVTERRL